MRSAGILLHISSLPNEYGIGTLGKESFDFIDFLVKAKQKYWQVLPINPTSYGDSPYQSFCSFAGNPYFINYELLLDESFLEKEDYYQYKYNKKTIDYSFLFTTRFGILRKGYEQFKKNKDKEQYELFKLENKYWLLDYALFMALKAEFGWVSWLNWPKKFKNRNSDEVKKFHNENLDKVEFWKFIQYSFYKQWSKLKHYANDNGVLIIGDMPIYTSLDSSDCWARPDYWQLDKEFYPTEVAGVPPDLFSPTGQLWGNPVYNYSKMAKDSFSWWVERIKQCQEIFDVIRIDHFRGFESFYSIPYGSKTAENGTWIKGPGYELFSKIHKQLGEVEIIAEDLGLITNEVKELLERCNYPGMKILQFGFDNKVDSLHAPHHHNYNSVVYPGTHDNPPIKGWYKSLTSEERDYVNDYLQLKFPENICEAMIKECLKSVCKIAIIPVQDYLEEDMNSRMNTPSTINNNWVYRVRWDDLNDNLAKKIKTWTSLYRR